VTYWLKPIGHARGPLPAAWFEEKPGVLRRTGFPRRPRVADGDRFVYYASVWKRVFAIVEVVGEPEETGRVGTDRWPWTVAVDPLLVIPLLEHAPPVEAIGVAARSTSQQSHIRLSPEHYARAVDVIASVAH
jgi:hypothetical protein